MIVKSFIFCLSALFLLGCSGEDNSFSSTGDLTNEECEKIGGKIIEGIGCAKDIPKSEMKSMCVNNGMKYADELNGCIE